MSNHIIRNVLSIVKNRILILIFSLGAEAALVFNLAPEIKGEIFYLRGNIELVAIIFSFGLGNALVHYRSQGKVYNYSLWVIFVASIACLAFFLLSFSFSSYRDIIFTKVYFYCALCSIAFLITLILQKLFLSDNRIDLHNFSTLLPKTLYLSGFIIISFQNIQISTFILIYLFAHAINIIIFSQKTNANIPQKRNFHRKVLMFSLGTHVYEMIFNLRLRIENVIVLLLLQESLLGVFSVAKNLSALVIIIISSVCLIIFREISSGSISQTNLLVKTFIRYSFFLLILVLLSFLTVDFLSNFLPATYSNVRVQFPIVIIGVFFLGLSSFLQIYFQGVGDTKIPILSLLISFLPYIFFVLFTPSSEYTVLIIFQLSYILQFVFLLSIFILHLRKEHLGNSLC